jgi:ATP-dependent DNA helicase RecQ
LNEEGRNDGIYFGGEPLNVLQQLWGHGAFRAAQEDIVRAVLAGHDTLALLPTGGGKSVCFQVPALCQEGICLVISPLIALMKDQVYQLTKRGIPATAIFSGISYRDIDRILDNCVYGGFKFLYLSPERLVTELMRERIKQMNVNLIAVDEAHCISQWGYDFRPSYLQIAEMRELCPKVPILALTATATREVVADIQERLAFKNGQLFQKSFQRENLSYSVLQEEAKMEKLLDILRKVPGSGIVYVRNRKHAKDVAQWLQRKGISADFYHAGLPTEERSKKQDAWMAGDTRLIVSTNAFGMGIDKPNVRLVVHLDLPDSLEAYFQEAGRGGRDGQKSYAVLLYNEKDRLALERQLQDAFPSMGEIRNVYRALGSYYQLAIGSGGNESFDFNFSSFVENYKLDGARTYHCLKVLEQSGWLTLTEAVFLPMSVQFIVSKEALYDFQLKNSHLDLFIRSLLRSYPGIFSHPTFIRDEGKLAAILNIGREQLRATLQTLQKEGILDYRASKDAPQIVFLQERVAAENLTIDYAAYEFRRLRQAERTQRAIAYAEKLECRSRQLLRYFGETDAPLCGVCDVCTGRHETALSKEEFERYKEKIRLLLEKEQLTLEQILESFAPRRANKVLQTLEFLADEGLIAQNKTEKWAWQAKGKQ